MSKFTFRKLHRQLAPILFLPLLITATTGILYRLLRSWGGIPKDATEILMVIHQGEYLGDQIKPIYVLLNGLGLIGMLVTGLSMTGIFRKRRTQINDVEN